MIIHKKKSISAIRFQEKTIAAVYKAGQVIWQAIRSCFGAGYWINEYPWSNQDGWNNN
jgi:hypothetical protein